MGFNERLKRLREATGVSQKNFAESIGLRKDLYNKYEQGVARPSYETLLAIANKLDVSTDYLLGRDGGGLRPESVDLYEKIKRLPPNQRKAVEILLGLEQ